MLSDEVKELINTLNLGEVAGTAYEGDKGKANADAIKILDASIKAMNNSLESVSFIMRVNEPGFHFSDSTGKDVMNYTEKGFDVAKVSSHFIEVLNRSGISGSLTYEIINDKIYNF